MTQFSNVSEVFIDPEQSNKRVVHVYQKEGFKIIGGFEPAWHPVPHYLIKLEIKDVVVQGTLYLSCADSIKIAPYNLTC